MVYVIGALLSTLAGFVIGWGFYQGSVGPKKSRIFTSAATGVVIAILFFISAFSD